MYDGTKRTSPSKKVTIDDEVRDLGCFVVKHALEEFEDAEGVIRIRISKKNRQHNGQRKKYKWTNNDLQNIHKKLKIE